jgi:hypothetical protein
VVNDFSERKTASIFTVFSVVILDVLFLPLLFVSKMRLKMQVRLKVQFTLEEATKAQRGSRGLAQLFL